jgi:hypothetical protein
MRRIMMTLGCTAVVLGSSLVASGQDKGVLAPAQVPVKQAPIQAAVKQAPVQTPLQAPSKPVAMQAPIQKPLQAPVQAPIKGKYSADNSPGAASNYTVAVGRRGIFGRR